MNDTYQNFLVHLLKDKENLSDFLNEKELSNLYNHLLKFSQNQLNDNELAQDAVQECLMGAIKDSHKFKGNCAFKSWVFAILKHKISDILRNNQKYVLMSELSANDDDELELSELMFQDSGHWQDEYLFHTFDNSWNDPEIHAHNQDFWQVLEYCLSHLKGEQARVFLMKEYLGLDSNEICQTLKISHQNYYVLMYRARINLQACLTRHWFDDERKKL
ncbi:sigma-70 family RNA polymerase sigma factor [Moraxella oblonga]|uniref:sigma-70 family RNA polymerase sigma factor n=1 Tax=Moraxella oblonga TaxID=200413 RepID=UPI000835C7DD|nr:sigma-70 family RNA polymerase sigma factor [Moraxella oblonga]